MVYQPLVTYEMFAEISCMGGFAFGVKTSCDSCDFKANGCLRRHIEDTLLINELATEKLIGYDLSGRHHVEEIDWDGRSPIKLKNHGIAALNVAQSVTRVAEDTAISHFIIEDAVVASGIVTVALAIADNPDHLMFRHTSSNNHIEQLQENGYPRIEGDNWKIKLNTAETEVNVQHCKYMRVTIATPVCVEGEIFAVRPDTEVIIPFAKSPVVSGGNTTYWFYSWSLIADAFKYDDTIDLEAGQYYKLLRTIDFVCLKDVEAHPQVMCSRAGCDDDLDFEEDEHIILTSLNDNFIDVYRSSSSEGCGCSEPMKLRISYRTDPSLVQSSFDGIIKAIVYLTAAELPLRTCNCEPPDHGFIRTAQEEYATLKINPITGYSGYQYKYGSRYGQLVYASEMEKVTKKGRVVAIL